MNDVDYNDTFEDGDAGSSMTFPRSVGELKKGGHMVIDKRACKIVDLSCHKTGKHGHAKASILAVDIFNQKKMEESIPCSFTAEVPNIKRTEYALFSIDEEGYCNLMDTATSAMRCDIKLPDDTDDDKVLSKGLEANVEQGVEMNVTVLSAMGIEKIVECKPN
jgi:translation initiation factor 5A